MATNIFTTPAPARHVLHGKRNLPGLREVTGTEPSSEKEKEMMPLFVVVRNVRPLLLPREINVKGKNILPKITIS